MARTDDGSPLGPDDDEFCSELLSDMTFAEHRPRGWCPDCNLSTLVRSSLTLSDSRRLTLIGSIHFGMCEECGHFYEMSGR